MANKILEQAVGDLLSIPPVIHRTTRQKLVRTAFGDFSKNCTPLHIEIIRLLEDEEEISIGEMGEKLMIAKAQMTHLIEKLVSLNIVERRLVEGDRRKIKIALTANGASLLAEHKRALDVAVMETMAHLSNKDLQTLSESLKKVKAILRKLK